MKKKKGNVQTKSFGLFGGLSSSLGFIGLHNVCHLVCQGLIAFLTIFGIFIVGMPLAFLQDYSFFFAVMGLASASVGIGLFLWTKFTCRMKKSKKEYIWLAFNFVVIFISSITLGGFV